jgi:hypothetical protein
VVAERVMGEYFEALASGDLVRFFTEDVSWTTMETGAQLQGPLAVQAADLSDVRIASTRAYGALASMMPRPSTG